MKKKKAFVQGMKICRKYKVMKLILSFGKNIKIIKIKKNLNKNLQEKVSNDKSSLFRMNNTRWDYRFNPMKLGLIKLQKEQRIIQKQCSK